MSLSVSQSLRGKSVLITGTTGFVGKVLVEKILRDIPDVGKLFLLIRGKSASERLEKEIIESKIFTRLRSQREDFEQFVRSKLVPIAGDVLLDNVGVSHKDLKMLQNEVNYVVHCAATVDFREKLENAMKKNVLGTLQLFDLAKTFKNLIGFVHVSTAYVNSDRQGFIAEELPPLTFDPEEMVQMVLSMDPAEVEKITPKLIGNYPNTYTFTKAIAERILEKRRGNIPVSYVRPTIIGASWREPFAGWIDSVSAIAAVILYTGVGVVRFIQGDKNLICDIVPVDTVCNGILAAIPSLSPEKITIYHVGTSQANPARWEEAARWVSTYWRQHNVKRRFDKTPLRFRFYSNRILYRTQYFLSYELPATLYGYFAKTLGTREHKKNAELMKKMTGRTMMVSDTFVHFTSTQWIFDVTNTERASKALIPEERPVFGFNVGELDWEKYYRFFCYGMQKYVIQEEVKPPTDLLKIDLIQEPRKIDTKTNNAISNFLNKSFPDIAWSYKTYQTNIGIDNFMTLRTPAETKALILKSKKVQEVIKQVAEAEKVQIGSVERRAQEILDRMAHNLNLPIIRALGWFLRKVWRRIYHGIHVEEKGLENVRKVLGNGPIILVPTHRSYVDFLIVSYIFFEYDLPLPHIAAGEDFLAVMFVNWIFRNSGAFFLRRSFKGDQLYTALFTEYVQRLISDWSPIEFFIEGKRSRSGKTLHPKYGLLSICCDPFFNKKVPDATIVPISISYEKVIEADLFTNELLGESKTKESFQGLMRASHILSMNFGRIHVIFNDPISLKEFSVNAGKAISPSFDPYTSMEDRKHVVHELAYKIVYELNQGQVLTTSALLSTIILTYRKGITPLDLVQKVDWLREQIHQKGASVAYEGTTEDLVESALKLLKNAVQKVRGVYIPLSANDKDTKSTLILDFYRNQLLHLFTGEGMVSCVISKEGNVLKEDLIKESEYLVSLLQLEFVTKPSSSIKEKFGSVIDAMVERGILAYNSRETSNPMVSITPEGEGIITFLNYLYWPLLDSYWVAALSLFSLQPNLQSKRKLLLQKISWLADKMHSEGKISFFESCSMEVLSNCLELFANWKVIDVKEVKPTGGRRGQVVVSNAEDYLVSLHSPYQQESVLQEFVETINKFRKIPNNALNTRLGLRKAVMADFPMLAKL